MPATASVINKDDLAESLYNGSEDIDSKAAARRIIDNLFEEIGSALAGGADVKIAGFGNFKTKKRAARNGRNPHTGETIKVPAKTVASWKASAPLAERVNSKKKKR